MGYDGKKGFILEEYNIEPDAEIQMQLLRKDEKFRSTRVEINDDISSIELLKMETDTQQEQEVNILSSTTILKFMLIMKIT